MPDNNKDQFDLGSDFDFAAIAEFESDGKGSKPSEADDDASPEFAEFETAGSEPDFASFGGEQEFEDSTPTVDFGSEEFEPTEEFAGGADFDFGGPPSPQSVELESLSGNPDEEFGDFGADGGFGDDDIPADPYAEDDEAPAKTASRGGSVDPFADDEQDADQTEEVADAAVKDNTKPGIKHYAGIAAVVAVVGYIGYSQVLPMFVSTEEGQVVADTKPLIESGSLPAGLPPASQPSDETAGLPQQLPVKEPVAEPVAAPVDGSAPASLPSLELPGTTPVAVDTPVTVDAKNPIEITPIVAPSVETAVKIDAPVKVDPLDEMVGGSDRGGLASMKDDAQEAAPVKEAPVVASADIAALASRLDEVVKRIETIEQKVASFGASFEGNGEIKTPVTSEKPAVLPAAADGGVSAPLKPPIIENVVLRGVSRDIAWIATGKGVVEVKVGDSIEDAGVVESFQNYRGRWIAVTDKGIILPR
ncbi:hypothetical protein OIU34_24575 [Pararhizobium sp. BT-229]|uniref:hypothetical protein n=1 Tax=Pararhizobium sp. BT-229 TaxID=2986923 RepID=UPI0021F75B53|nr:hypothetical protein [Pararhizobium sp. BT-229]MCV9965077.1 hypothetical protein [Pararhizobium sp. BT-229]